MTEFADAAGAAPWGAGAGLAGMGDSASTTTGGVGARTLLHAPGTIIRRRRWLAAPMMPTMLAPPNRNQWNDGRHYGGGHEFTL